MKSARLYRIAFFGRGGLNEGRIKKSGRQQEREKHVLFVENPHF
jgi:hypothetical protein